MGSKKIKKMLIAAIIIAAGAGGYYYYFNTENSVEISFKTVPVEVRDVVQTIDATGTLEPEELVDVGARVSGEIVSFGKDKNGKEVDYGSEITEGSLIALIDDEIPQSDLLQSKAKLEAAKASEAQANASLELSQTNLKQAQRDWARAKRLGVSEALSQASYDSYLSAWEVATAQIEVARAQIKQAKAGVAQAEAALKVAERNLEYCVIKAPVNGVVIDRKVNVGQTVVSNMSASSLFLIAKDLKRMEVWASVNEADIGNISKGQRVTFTVDAFPRRTFEGVVEKVRLNATMTQNVVTYVVEVVTDNSDGKLLPYLTANLSFEVKRCDKAIAVPNAALRFSPTENLIAEGVDMKEFEDARKVWVLDGKFVRPIKVERLITDGAYTAIKSDSLTPSMEVVTSAEDLNVSTSSGSNPFMPKMPQRKKGNSTSTKK